MLRSGLAGKSAGWAGVLDAHRVNAERGVAHSKAEPAGGASLAQQWRDMARRQAEAQGEAAGWVACCRWAVGRLELGACLQLLLTPAPSRVEG